MPDKDDGSGAAFICYVNGFRYIKPSDEVQRLFRAADFAWVLRTDDYRSGCGKDAKSGYVGKVAKEAGRRFGYALLTHGSLPLTIDDDCLLDEHGRRPGRNLFACWAAKFGRLFEGEKPYAFSTVLLDGDVPVYRMKPGKRWIIVVGIDPDCGISDVEFDWRVFESPTGGHKRSA